MESLAEMYHIQTQHQTDRANETARILSLRLSQIDARAEALTDIFIEGAIDRKSYDTRKTVLQNERFDAKSELENIQNTTLTDDRLAKFLELAKCLSNMAGLPNEQVFREYAKSAISNLSVCRKTVDIKWSGAVYTLLDIGGFKVGALGREESRTCRHKVTECDAPSNPCPKCVTEHDEFFKTRMGERGDVLYHAIIADEQLDQLSSIDKRNVGTSLAA